MDRLINMKTDKQTIYEIYRSCRLCGGGAGYKMPIVQTVIDLDNNGVELKHKIQECLQIEVHQDDKMPPLICELCVDKVNDFYEFMEMCKQINKRTRLRLGLPAQSFARSAVSNDSSDSGDCILGVTEPVYIQDDDDNEPLSKSVKVKKKDSKKNEKILKDNVKIKKEKEPEVKIKIEKVREPSPEIRKTRHAQTKRDPTPPRGRSTRHSVGSSDDNTKLSYIKSSSKSSSSSTSKSSPQTPRSILKKEMKELMLLVDDDAPRTKRLREKDLPTEKRADVPSKRVKIAVQPVKQSPPKPKPKSKIPVSPQPGPKSKRAVSPKPKRASSPPMLYPCPICGAPHKSAQGNANHIKSHVVTFTNPKLACDPCGEWFSTGDESASHHKKHKTKPYYCRHCYDGFRTICDYDKHFELNICQPYIEVPDMKCDECWRTYATQNLLELHRCQGPDGRPGGKCKKCNRMYTLLKNLKKHETTCTFRKKGEAIIEPEVEKQLKDTQIRLTRCDELLTRIKGERYDISDVDHDFGFDSSCIYPYRYRIKSEPTTGYDTMVTIGDEIKQEYYSKNYVHWDSDDSDSDGEKGIHSLTTLSLKTIFSNKFIGKVPRKRRKIKSEKFDNADFDMSRDIDSIIDNLGKDEDFKDSANDSDCSESIFGPFNKKNDLVSDQTFDSLLGTQSEGRNFDAMNDSSEKRNAELDGDSQDSQSLISSMPNHDIDLNNESQINDVSRDVSNENDALRSDDKSEDAKVTVDEPTNDSSIVDNDNENNDLSKTENNDTHENDKLDSNEQSKVNEDSSVGNNVSDNLSIDRDNVENNTEGSNLESNSEESDVRLNGQPINHSNDFENANDRDLINGNEDRSQSIENNDRISNKNDSNEHKNVINNDVSKINEVHEGISENNGNGDDIRTDKVTLDDIVPKENNLKDVDLDSISDGELNYDA